MAYKETDTTLSIDIPTVLFDALEQQRVSRNQTKKGVVAAAINLWVSLPKEIQDQLTDMDRMAGAIELVVRRIVGKTVSGSKADLKRQGGKSSKVG